MNTDVLTDHSDGDSAPEPSGNEHSRPLHATKANHNARTFTICVTGDDVVHWMEVIGPAGMAGQHGRVTPTGNVDFMRIWSRPWGAALVRELLEQSENFLDGMPETERVKIAVTPRKLVPDALRQINFPEVIRDYALWGEDEEGICRMQKFLFRQDADKNPLDHISTRDGAKAKTADEKAAIELQKEGLDCNCLIIDDIGRGFRAEPFWPRWLELAVARDNVSDHALPEGLRHVFLKTSGPLKHRDVSTFVQPLLESRLWRFLINHYAEILTVYCKVDSLRQANFAPVGLPLSWERTANDVVKAVMRSELAKAERIVVSLGLSGAVIIEQGANPTLIFDKDHQEGDFERKFAGQPIGLGRYIIAAMAIAAAQKAGTGNRTGQGDPNQRWPLLGVERGLNAARTVHQEGYGSRRVRPNFVHHHALQWIFGDLRGNASPFSQRDIRTDDDWRLVGPASSSNYLAHAEKWVKEGKVSGDPFPIEQMGGWISVDRDEIESMRSLKNIIREYLARPQKKGELLAPLNLAVFGQPGAGKSYAVKQMIEAMEREKHQDSTNVVFCPFNLAQFASTGDLPATLHKVRDIVVGGKTPVVFWDEFDTTVEGKKLGWLASFLQPMQDGVFLDSGHERPIGRAIFVFAGGVFHTMSDFQAHAQSTSRGLEDENRYPLTSSVAPPAKASDFLSRLRGYVDILGPNPVHYPGKPDTTYVLRRALLLRSLLTRNARHLIEMRDGKEYLRIDDGVLNAFLGIQRYSHGSRSMESLITMSALSGKKSFERSSLPAKHQINLHVNAEEFLKLVEAEQPEKQ